MSAALALTRTNGQWVLCPPAPPALGQLLGGMTAQAAVSLLPRLFNLCATAQGMAARLSLGLPPAADARAALARDVLRDHVLALFVTLPQALGQAPRALPAGWQMGRIAPALWGGAEPVDLARWLDSGAGLAPLAQHIRQLFSGGLGHAPVLPFADAENIDRAGALENSPAARHAAHPLMQQAEAAQGRGPLWRVLGRMLDAGCAAKGTLPAPALRADGMALVPAARGVYGLRLLARNGVITDVARITPTDHMLAMGGSLRAALATTPDPALARVIVAAHDPCLPVHWLEGADA
ncbi:hydrogenase expression/formation protein HupK [Roseinatronobacter sp. NSM]|uniref:hydrogenase expression/formation protein HupK n=1 Tax=Roseinatronobacter sp. NSM TaxID=3457785 RepID=UPI0040362E4C